MKKREKKMYLKFVCTFSCHQQAMALKMPSTPSKKKKKMRGLLLCVNDAKNPYFFILHTTKKCFGTPFIILGDCIMMKLTKKSAFIKSCLWWLQQFPKIMMARCGRRLRKFTWP